MNRQTIPLPMHAFSAPSRNSGLTLIEVMISILIGLMLLAGTTSMFMSNKRIYREQESMSRLQENARFALDILMRDIRMAGYTGCHDQVKSVANHVNGGSDIEDVLAINNPIEGWESAGNWLPSNSTDQVATIVANSDGITVRYLSPSGIKIAADMPNTSAELKVTTSGDLEQFDVIGLSDCDSADIMQLTAIQDKTGSGTTFDGLQHNTGIGTPGNGSQFLQKSYLTGAEIMRYVARRYYITEDAVTGTRYLTRKDPGGTVHKLIAGVHQMQLLYGEDNSGDQVADNFFKASAITDWNSVVSVRLSLLMQTLDENNLMEKDSKDYLLLGGNAAGGYTFAAANDYRRRRVFTTTIQIRNRSS